MNKNKISLYCLVGLVAFTLFGGGDLTFASSRKLTQQPDSLTMGSLPDSMALIKLQPSHRLPVLKYLEMQDEETGGFVIVATNANIQLDNRQEYNVKGFRIRLFFDNSQDARLRAAETETFFKANYPDVMVYLQYHAPYFTVSVGDYASYTEAYANAQKILKDFPKAFVVQQEIPISYFNGKRELLLQVDSVTNINTSDSLPQPQIQ